MEGHYTSPTQPAVALSFLCILLDIIKNFLETECPSRNPFIDPSSFYDGSSNYYHFDRIGGVLSYLKRHYHQELIEKLGRDHWYLQPDQMQPTASGPDLNDICELRSVTEIKIHNPFNSISFLCDDFRLGNVHDFWRRQELDIGQSTAG